MNNQQLKQVSQTHLERLRAFPPAIPYQTPKKKGKNAKEQKDDDSDDESRYRKIQIKFNIDDPKSDGAEWKVPVFDHGTPEEWCKWRIELADLEVAYPFNDPTNEKQQNIKLNVIRSLLTGEARERFQRAYEEAIAEKKGDSTTSSLNAIAKWVFENDVHAWRRQKSYMMYDLAFEAGKFTAFKDRVKTLNKYLEFFPANEDTGEAQTLLTNNDILQIMDHAKPMKYSETLLINNFDVYSHTLDEFEEYIERLEKVTKMTKRAANVNNSKQEDNQPGDNGGTNNGRGSRKTKNKKGKTFPKCATCGKHHKGDCWMDPKNKDKKPEWFRASYENKNNATNRKRANNNDISFSADQVNYLISKLPGIQPDKKRKKRKVQYHDSSGSDNGEESMHFLSKSLAQTKVGNTSDSDSMYSQTTPTNRILSIQTCYAFTNRLSRNKKQKIKHYTTEVVGEVKDRNGDRVPIRVLLDTGSSSSIILRQFVQYLESKKASKCTKWNTLGGTFHTEREAEVYFKLPDFHLNSTIVHRFHVDEQTKPSDATYDMIIGNDLMEKLRMDISFSTNTITWDESDVPMLNRGTLQNRDTTQTLYEMSNDAPILKLSEERHNEIIKAMYKKVDIDEYTSKLAKLTTDQQTSLAKILKQSEQTGMFEGTVGTLNVPPVKIELKTGTKPYHGKPFPVPKAHEQLTRAECERFCQDGIWEKATETEHAYPSFFVLKKTGDGRIVTDFRELNKNTVRKPFPLPKILEILQKMEGFAYATALDLRKGYYHIPLDKPTSKLCTTIFPWGKYSYKKLAMGLKQAPDIFQKVIQDCLGDLSYVIAYIDDILILSNKSETFDQHLLKIRVVLQRLRAIGFKVNLHKSEFCTDTVEYLGYLLTPDGIKPQPKKVEAIYRLKAPTTVRQLRRFLGMINFYRDMWKRRSHVLAPLTALVGSGKKKSFKWGKEQEQAFKTAKALLVEEARLAYPDFSKEFHVYADASDIQLGGVVMQETKPLAFYTRKLNSAQKNYAVGHKELLSIVETVKQFESMLLGQNVTIHTDHLNLLYTKQPSQRLMRWRAILEEFGPKVEYIKGERNVAADALSRLDIEDREEDLLPSEDPLPKLSYAITKNIEEEKFPMSPILIEKHQKRDRTIKKTLQNTSSKGYEIKTVEGKQLVHYNHKIWIPQVLEARVMAWYHEYLVHPGEDRMEQTIRSIFYWPNMRKHVQEYVKTCKVCQLSKKRRLKYGKLPAKQAETELWQRVNVDLIGPYRVKGPKRKTYDLRAMTMIDPASSWFEIAAIAEPSAQEAQAVLDSYWLARYPRPKEIGFDNGSEFKSVFRELCLNYGMTPKPTTPYNPQGNSVIERIHQVVGDSLRTFALDEQNLTNNNPFEPFLTSVAYAIRSTYHTTLQATPGQLVFGRDMILPIRFKADWAMIAQRKQAAINANNNKENKKRKEHTYHVNDLVLVTKPGIIRKMERPRIGPFKVIKVSTNGTVRIKQGAVIKRINIRRITPYFERHPSGSA